MGARKKDEREKIPDKILAILPEDHGIPAKELKARTKGICAVQLLYKHLDKNLIPAGRVLVEGSASRPLYRRSPWIGPAQLARPPKDLKSEIRTIDDLFARIDLDFERAYYLYVKFLRGIVENPEIISSATGAHDLFDYLFETEIKRPLGSIAQFVWQKGESLKIGDVYPLVAVALFRPKTFLPKVAKKASTLTISQAMSMIRNIEKKIAKKTDELGKEKVEEIISQLLRTPS